MRPVQGSSNGRFYCQLLVGDVGLEMEVCTFPVFKLFFIDTFFIQTFLLDGLVFESIIQNRIVFHIHVLINHSGDSLAEGLWCVFSSFEAFSFPSLDDFWIPEKLSVETPLRFYVHPSRKGSCQFFHL